METRTLVAVIRSHLVTSLGTLESDLRPGTMYKAVALAVRDFATQLRLRSEREQRTAGGKRVYYLSMEYLIGRLLEHNVLALGIRDELAEAVAEFGFPLDALFEEEVDAALGNGGLGRLAACYLESMATLGVPGHGYGINYEYGLFRQQIHRGEQREYPDSWREDGTPWLNEYPEQSCLVPVYGKVIHGTDREGRYNPMWLEWRTLIGVPHDMAVVGWDSSHANTLRLFSARASSEFDISIFNAGDYIRAVEQKVQSETVSKVLYPSDDIEQGRELRLVQEYFFVACSIRDILRRFDRDHGDLDRLPDKVAIQLNDTHPALAVVELMRVLVDERDVPWEHAWDLVQRTMAYTNHTLLPEALEKWPVHLLERVVPRHMQLIYEINRRFLERIEVRWPDDGERRAQYSLIEETHGKQVRMAHLSIVGSHAVNGVAKLHTRLLTTRVVPQFAELWPERFWSRTNGITHRRWLIQANPALSRLVTEAIGDGWIRDANRLRDLEPFAEDASFREEFAAVKRACKERLAGIVRETTMVEVDPDALFSIHAKRIHEYKRQLLNALFVIHHYLRIVEHGETPPGPRVHLLAGKAAPGYHRAKQVIRLVHAVADVVNADPRTNGLLRVAFLPDYRVTLAERLIPAADLSEQISTAGTEASGTGNMKFALNGALTMGTLDGANIEIRDEVGEENLYLFGLRAEQIEERRRKGGGRARDLLESSATVRGVMDAFERRLFSAGEPGLFRWLPEALLDLEDPYFHLADLDSYAQAQDRAAADYRKPDEWFRRAILNVARVGWFSSDRAIREYAADIWDVPVPAPPAGSAPVRNAGGAGGRKRKRRKRS